MPVLITLIRCLLIAGLLLIHLPAAYSDPFQVTFVFDGDTVELNTGQRVRYLGIDTPEIDHENNTAEPFGFEARRYNERLVLNKTVRLEYDRERYDRYGRLLAYIFLSDGTLVNEVLLQEGLGYYLFVTAKGEYDKRLLAAQQQAMATGKGIWKNWQEPEGVRYTGNQNSRRFHLETCHHGRKIAARNRVEITSQWDGFQKGLAPARCCIKPSN